MIRKEVVIITKGRPRGSFKKPESDLKVDVVKNKVEAIKPVEKQEKIKYKCCCCGTLYDNLEKNFPFSQSAFFKGNNNRLPICNSCFDEMTSQYEDLLGSSDAAIKRMCLHWDMYVEDGLFTSSRKIDASRSRIKAYVKNCNMTQYAGKTFDTYLKEQESNAINNLDDLADAQEKSDTVLSEKNTVRVWGFGFSPEEFTYLNNQYSDWKAKVVIDGKARESLVRDLCVIKMHQQNAIKAKDIDLYNKLQKTYQDTLTSANLKPVQEDNNDKAGEKPMGVMIDMFENEQPIPEPLECWKDVDGIMKLITVYFLGHLCKMLGFKNRFSKMYEDEMAKYRVEIPELEELDDEDVFEFLSNNTFVSSSDGDNDVK